MLENRMVVGSPGDYYNAPFERTPLEIWSCPCCHTQWELFDQHDAERSLVPWEAENKYGYTRLSEDPRLNGCCELCAINSASKETLIAYIEKHHLVRHVVEVLSLDEQYIQRMWEAIKSCESIKAVRNDLADIVEHDYKYDFIDWRRER